jgi:hypothetical protein
MKKVIRYMFPLSLAGILLISACEKVVYPPPEIPDQVSFSQDIQPIFDSKCTTCHNGGRDPDLRPDHSHASLVDGGYVDTSSPEDSKLIKKLYGTHDSRATEADKQKILVWITEGAQDN